MKRLSKQETAEAFGEFAEKAERIAKPAVSKAKGCFFCLLAIFIFIPAGLGLLLGIDQAEFKAVGLLLLAIGLFLAISGFLPDKPAKIAGDLLFIVFGIVFAFFGYNTYQMGTQSQGWPAVEGSMIQSKIEKHTETTGSGGNRRKAVKSHAVVKYTYSVDNRDYESSRVSYFSGKNNAYEIVSRYPEGKSIQVYYNPQKPAQAVLEPGADTTGCLVFFGIGAGITLIGLRLSFVHWKKSRALSN